MKTKVLLVSTLLASFVLASCGGNNPSSSSKSEDKSSSKDASSSEIISSESPISTSSQKSSIPISDEYYENVLVDYAGLLDPAIIHADDGKYYCYVTEGTQKWRGKDSEPFLSRAPIYVSEDMVHWTYHGDVASPKEMSEWKWAQQLNFWSPEIAKIKDKYVFYFSLGKIGGGKTNGVGAAYSTSPTGPFTPVDDAIITSEDVDNLDAIDPCVVQENGRVYMFYGNYDGIFAIELNDDGLAVKNGATPIHIAGEQTGAISYDDYTAPYLRKINNKWCLFLSTGQWASITEQTPNIYHTVVFSSDTLIGEYKDSQGRSAKQRGNGDLVMQSDENFVGPGNVCVIEDNVGADYIYFHTYLGGKVDTGERFMGMERLDTETKNYPFVKENKVHKQVNKPLI